MNKATLLLYTKQPYYYKQSNLTILNKASLLL